MAAVCKKKVYTRQSINAAGRTSSYETLCENTEFSPVRVVCQYGIAPDGTLRPAREWKALGLPKDELRTGWLSASDYVLAHDVAAVKKDPNLVINWTATDIMRGSMLNQQFEKFRASPTLRYSKPKSSTVSRKEVFIIGHAELSSHKYRFWTGIPVLREPPGEIGRLMRDAFGDEASYFVDTKGRGFCLFKPMSSGLGLEHFTRAKTLRDNHMLQARMMFG